MTIVPPSGYCFGVIPSLFCFLNNIHYAWLLRGFSLSDSADLQDVIFLLDVIFSSGARIHLPGVLLPSSVCGTCSLFSSPTLQYVNRYHWSLVEIPVHEYLYRTELLLIGYRRANDMPIGSSWRRLVMKASCIQNSINGAQRRSKISAVWKQIKWRSSSDPVKRGVLKCVL